MFKSFGMMNSMMAIARLFGLMGPGLPIAGSSFRKRSSNRRWKSRAGIRPMNRTGWWCRRADISPMVITERMLMRHGWYRRQLRKQGVAIDPNAKNAMVLR